MVGNLVTVIPASWNPALSPTCTSDLRCVHLPPKAPGCTLWAEHVLSALTRLHCAEQHLRGLSPASGTLGCTQGSRLHLHVLLGRRQGAGAGGGGATLPHGPTCSRRYVDVSLFSSESTEFMIKGSLAGGSVVRTAATDQRAAGSIPGQGHGSGLRVCSRPTWSTRGGSQLVCHSDVSLPPSLPSSPPPPLLLPSTLSKTQWGKFLGGGVTNT